jgi:hypothetical protein
MRLGRLLLRVKAAQVHLLLAVPDVGLGCWCVCVGGGREGGAGRERTGSGVEQ